MRGIRLGDVGDSCTEGGILGDGLPLFTQETLGAFRGSWAPKAKQHGDPEDKGGSQAGARPSNATALAPTQDPRPSRGDSPELGWGLASVSGSRSSRSEPWSAHQRQPLGSVASAVTAVSGLNHLTSHAPPAPGMLGGDKSARAQAPRKVPATNACAAASASLPQAWYSVGSSPA